MWTARSDNRVFIPVAASLVVTAWLALAVWGASPAAYLLDHDTLGHSSPRFDATFLVTIAAFVAGWNLMVTAMMLPTIIPLLSILRLSAGPVFATRATVFAAAGYVAVWSAFGTLAHAADYGIHQAVDSSPWLHQRSWIIGVASLFAAGIYQFTPLKHLCLERCRTPFSFVAARWHGRRPRRQALRIGLDHGLFCMGCCWALMLLMFAVSAGNLAWMLILAAVMGIEKNLPWGRRLTAPLGLVLLTAGITITIGNLD